MKPRTHSTLYSPSFITMACAQLFTASSFGSFFLFPLFITDHGGSKADVGIIMGVLSLSSVLSRPWISELIDRIGRKRSYTIGCLLFTFLPLTYLLFRGDIHQFYFSLILVRLLHGVGLAICFTAPFTYIADIIPKERLNEGIGMFGVAGLTGVAIGPAIAEGIIRQLGFSAFFLSSAAMGALGLLLQLPLNESYSQTSQVSSMSFFSVLFKGRIITVGYLALLFGFGLAAPRHFLAPYAVDRHLTFLSLYYIAYSLAAVMTRPIGGRLSDRIGEDLIIPYGLGLTGAGLFILIFPGGIALLILSGLMSGCGQGLLFPCLNSFAIRNEPINIRGKIIGIFTGGIDGGVFVGSIILGYVGEWAGFKVLFFVAGFALLTGLGIYKAQGSQAK